MRYLKFSMMALLLGLIGCDIPSQIVKIGGDSQVGAPGTECEEPLMVRVLSAQKTPVENVSVFFSTSPPHSVGDEVVLTDANGIAFTSVHFGDRAGGFVVEADVPNIPSSPIIFTLSTNGDASEVESREIGNLDIPLSLVNIGDIFGEYLHEITVLDKTIFIPAGSFGSGVVVVDMQDPAMPRMANFVSGLNSRDLTIAGSHLFSVSGNDFNTLDITNPHAPVLVGSLDLNSGSGAAATTVAVSGAVAFVTGGGKYLGSYGALNSVDVSDPAIPKVGVRSDETGGADVVVQGQFAYVAAYEEGLFVFNISDPLVSLPMAGRIGTGGNATRLRVDGGTVYVLNVPQNTNIVSVAVIDVTDPASPQLVTVVSIPTHWHFGGYGYGGTHFGMTLAGSRLYVGGYDGVVVIDVSDPQLIDPMGRIDPSAYVGGVAELDGKLAVAHKRGLSVIEIVPISKSK